MAAQASNCSEDVSENPCFDFDPLVFETIDFHHEYAALTLSQVNGQLNTSTISPTNPMTSLMTNWQLNTMNGTSASSGTEYQFDSVQEELLTSSDPVLKEMVDLAYDIETNPLQSISTDIQPTIQAIGDEPQDGIGNVSEENPRTFLLSASVAVDNHSSVMPLDVQGSSPTTLESSEMSDEMEVEVVKTAINRHQQAVMRMRVQPVATQRFRYSNEGRRYLKNSRARPMSVELPQLTGCLSKANQSFWIQGILVTTRRNPHRKVFYHEHKMFYNGEGAIRNGLQSFRIPLTDEDIRGRLKTLKRLSIAKTKLEDYSFRLVPFDPLVPDDHVIDNITEDDEQLTTVQKAKRFDTDYHTEQFRIIWQLMIKQNEQWYPTDINCETRIITDG